MSNTEQLIASLSAKAAPVAPMAAPATLALRLSLLLLIYALLMGMVLGWREDLPQQLQRTFYLLELGTLFALASTSMTAAVYRAFPDLYQHPAILLLPVVALLLFMALLALQFTLPADINAVFPAVGESHELGCTLCIAGVAAIPSAIAMFLLRKGASVHPLMSGITAVLAAAAAGCLVLRLIEANDDPQHLLIWHYIPTLGFAALGGIAGKFLLKW